MTPHRVGCNARFLGLGNSHSRTLNKHLSEHDEVAAGPDSLHQRSLAFARLQEVAEQHGIARECRAEALGHTLTHQTI